MLCVSCGNHKHPDGILSEPQMVSILSDLHTVDGYMATLSYSDSTRINGQNLYETIYKKHNISRASYDKSLQYYSTRPEVIDSLYSLVEKRLDARAAALLKIEQRERRKQLQSK